MVASPTSTVPGAAADWRRLAVLTMSPATIPWLVAPIVTAASPVKTPARAWIGCASSPSAGTAATSSSAARTARSASSSWAVGAPQTAITASPMNFSTVPPCRSIDAAGHVEVAGQQLARLLGVAALGQRGEADQVGEEDRHEPPLGAGFRSRWPGGGGRRGRALHR